MLGGRSMITRGVEHGFEVYGVWVRRLGSSGQGVGQARDRIRVRVLGLGSYGWCVRARVRVLGC